MSQLPSQPMKMPRPSTVAPHISRRNLFAGAGTAGAVAAVASLLPSVQPEVPAAAAPRPMPERGGGYSLTDHVKQYYKTTRI